MLRISSLLREVYSPELSSHASKDNRSGYVIIWNLTGRCNLSCRHCYAEANSASPGGKREELNTRETKRVIDDLAGLEVLVLILSGGEPMLRADLYELAGYAQEKGISCALSTNGSLIDEAQVRNISESGIGYVGISIDGAQDRHDEFRGRKGAYEASLRGIRLCRDAGIKVGLRFSLTSYTASQLPHVVDLFGQENLNKLYVSHLNYSVPAMQHMSPGPRDTRRIMGSVVRTALDYLKDNSLCREIVTGNNEADGPFLQLFVEKESPELGERMHDLLVQIRGNGSGPQLANLDPWGDVHPDPFCRGIILGNVRKIPLSRILSDSSGHLLTSSGRGKGSFRGRCGKCRFVDVCAGNSRARAFAHSSDWWGSDPLCYLTDEEILLN
jgi:radical SAM protein with 4Fe4S-binding SPASM domain